MSDKMTPVYSGGLLYEYSDEGNDYGIVKIQGGKATPTDEFDAFKDALAKHGTPTGNGGASETTHAVNCPTQDPDTFDIDTSLIPEMPQEAEKYMKSGAGRGPGLNGDGSQEAEDSGTATASNSAGQPSPTAESQQANDGADGNGDGENAAALGSLGFVPAVVTGSCLLFALCGALL
jgi:1,3-beta-glucanosyltransferase GAS5